MGVSSLEADIIYTDERGGDVGAIDSAEGDFSVGRENSWQLSVPNRYRIDQGCYVYIDGTEFGGVVDGIEASSASSSSTYSGRTWSGMLASLVVCPPDGEGHAVIGGDANECIADVLSLCAGGHEPFAASGEPSGIEVPPVELPRYCDAYEGITSLLSSAGAVLRVRFYRGSCSLSAEAAGRGAVYSEDAAITVRRERPVNHLVCLGSGQLAARQVVHLYADAQGRVSREQSIFGAAHMSSVYELTNAESEDELVEKGTEELESMQQPASAEIEDGLFGSYEIGQTVVAVNEPRMMRAEAVVSERIARVSGRRVVIESATGEAAEASPEPE